MTTNSPSSGVDLLLLPGHAEGGGQSLNELGAFQLSLVTQLR